MARVMSVSHQETRFHEVLTNLRKAVPSHHEYPEVIAEEDARAFVRNLPDSHDASWVHIVSKLQTYELAMICRFLTLPEAASERMHWEPVLVQRSGVTLYLLLRALLQYHPHSVLLREVFITVGQSVYQDDSRYRSLLSVLRSKRDDFLTITAGSEPTETILSEILSNKTMIGIYCADQGVIRKAPFYHELREGFFKGCHTGAYETDERELLSCLDEISLNNRSEILAHFLDIHDENTFPNHATHSLIQLYGSPDQSVIWEDAEAFRKEHMESSTPMPAVSGLQALIRWFWRETMRSHFIEVPLKMEVLSRFVPQLVSVRNDMERKALLLEFESFTIIDFLSVHPFSWVCDSMELSMRYDELVRIMMEQETKETRHGRTKKIPEAKDFVIEQENGAIVRLTFVEVGKLYAIDMLSIRLGLMQREIWGNM